MTGVQWMRGSPGWGGGDWVADGSLKIKRFSCLISWRTRICHMWTAVDLPLKIKFWRFSNHFNCILTMKVPQSIGGVKTTFWELCADMHFQLLHCKSLIVWEIALDGYYSSLPSNPTKLQRPPIMLPICSEANWLPEMNVGHPPHENPWQSGIYEFRGDVEQIAC